MKSEAGPCLVLDLRWQSVPEGSWKREERRGSQREEVDWSAWRLLKRRRRKKGRKRDERLKESGRGVSLWFVVSEWDCSAAGLTWLQHRAKGQWKANAHGLAPTPPPRAWGSKVKQQLQPSLDRSGHQSGLLVYKCFALHKVCTHCGLHSRRRNASDVFTKAITPHHSGFRAINHRLI